MPRRTKKEKLRAGIRRLHSLTAQKDGPIDDVTSSNPVFKADAIKSLTIVLGIIALEIILYYGTMNNHLSLIMKLR